MKMNRFILVIAALALTVGAGAQNTAGETVQSAQQQLE